MTNREKMNRNRRLFHKQMDGGKFVTTVHLYCDNEPLNEAINRYSNEHYLN